MILPHLSGRQKSIRAAIVFALVSSGGCATSSGLDPALSSDPEKFGREISTSLLEGNPAEARETIAGALRAQPENGGYHLLNGLSYQIEDGSSQSLALAKVGYDAAVRFAPGNYWSHYLAGSAALDLQDYSEASEHFSTAILDDPERTEAFLGLAIAAYQASDLDVARAASDRALALAPTDALALRTAAYVAAASGESERLDIVSALAESVASAANEMERAKPRLAQLLRTASILKTQEPAVEAPLPQQPEPPVVPEDVDSIKQLMVEVTLLLNQNSTTKNTGINLLDGLTVQYATGQDVTETKVTGTPESTSRVFTSSISVPAIRYSLNLFNTKNDFYRVIARPSLVAYVGEQSEFFIGRTVNVGVSGVNLGSLQPVDVGTTVKITPSELTAEYAKFKVEIIRSFFSQESPGTFEQSLTTFKQTVVATAEVEFGKTLILSGLYEAVDLGASSKTPMLGDVPVVDTFFNARTRTQRTDVALILVTPKLAGSVDTDSREFRSGTLNRLLSLWKGLIDPASNMDAILGHLGSTHRGSKIYHPKTSDLRLPPVTNPSTVRSVIQETVAQLN